jgi:endonuclease/exonuclease/phosphatase family metal-dependent hydrolase
VIKLISLNIEGDNHLETALPFLESEDADVVCLQEVLGKDVHLFEEKLKAQGKYLPMLFNKKADIYPLPANNFFGILILTKLKVTKYLQYFYAGSEDDVPQVAEFDPNNSSRILLGFEVEKDNQFFRIFTTHFTWTPDGQLSQLQREHFAKMSAFLDKFDDLILCGDFNTPRGLDIWQDLSEKYQDNIPTEVTTTIDPNLHRVKNLQYVVDGIFSTPQYEVSNVRIKDGISDHQAIVAILTRAV